MVNRCRDYLRGRGRRVRTIQVDAATSVAGEDIGSVRLAADQSERLERAFHRPSPDHRAVLALRFTLDLPVRDVALTLGVPEGTVKPRLNAAITRLRSALKEDST